MQEEELERYIRETILCLDGCKRGLLSPPARELLDLFRLSRHKIKRQQVEIKKLHGHTREAAAAGGDDDQTGSL